MIDRDQIRVELAVERVVDTYALKGIRRGKWLRLSECPRCRDRSSREAIAIEISTGRWIHHGSERAAGGICSGDLFDLVAACEGLDTRKDFRRVLARCAEVAGIVGAATNPEIEARIQQRLKEQAAQDVIDRARRQRAAQNAAELWLELATRSDAGELYLTRRGLDPYPLVRAGAVRFDEDGNPCVALRSAEGRVTAIATRYIEPGGRPKVMVGKDTSTEGTFVDTVGSIAHGRDVFIVEGVMDALTAREAWPSATILGANGVGNVAKVAALAISRIRLARTRLVLVPHDDEKGIRAMTEAGKIAIAAGLDLESSLEVVALSHKDLNDAWCAGWRPQLTLPLYGGEP